MGVYQANMYLGIFQETKITNGVYTCRSARYIFVAADAPIRDRSRVAVFYQPSLRFSVEAIQQFGPNAVGFQMATSRGSGKSSDVTSPPTTS